MGTKISRLPRWVFAAVVALVCLALAAGGFFAGRRRANDQRPAYPVRYGVIEDIRFEEESAQVIMSGTVADANYKGLFQFHLEEDTPISWYGEKAAKEDLQVGDDIAVYWGGEISWGAGPDEMVDVKAVRLLR